MTVVVAGNLDSTPIKCQIAIPTAAIYRVVTTEEFSSAVCKNQHTAEENSYGEIMILR